MAAARIPVGELLVEAGVLDRGALELALKAQRATGMPLGRVIVSQGFASADTIANVLATQYGRMIRAEFGIESEQLFTDEAAARRAATQTRKLLALQAEHDRVKEELAACRQRLEQVEARAAAGSSSMFTSASVPSGGSASRGSPRGPRLGDLLVSKGLITHHQLDVALYESRNTRTLLGRVLLEKGFIFEDELARCLSEQWELEFISLLRVGVDESAARLLPKKIGLEFATIPVRFDDDEVVTVAFADPSDDGAIAAVEPYVASIRPAVAALSDITLTWQSIRG